METITWCVGIMVFGILLIGVVTTIVIKIDTVPNWRTAGKIVCWIIGILLFKLLLWGIYHHYKDTPGVSPKQTVSAEMPVVQPKEEWVFRWITLTKTQPLSVEIMENRNGIFKAVLHDTNGRGNDERVAGLTLRWEGENLLGTWTDYADGEGGNAYLYKASNNLWSGWWECNNGKTKVHIELKRK